MKRPEDVFTPRSADVNPEMYIPRRMHEDALISALRGKLHIIVHGESGTGKSWLYKKVFADENVHYVVANLANASRMGSITAELKNVVDREGKPTKTGYEEEKSTEINLAFASGNLSHSGQYSLGQLEPFEAALAALRRNAGKRPAALVFDNLEAAFTKQLLKELADLLILCDDPRYSSHGIRILIVGVPSGLKEYYYRTPHHATVANRIYEIPEVSRLEKSQCQSLVERGLVGQLRYEIEEPLTVFARVGWITDRVPQMVHEYCLELALLAEQNVRRITASLLDEADAAWLSKSLYHAYAVAESHMNERDTKAGRRNQTLYALSRCDGESFKAPEIEDLVRKHFPKSTTSTALNVPQMLGLISGTERPLIRRSPKGDAFQFADPRYRMVLRAMLVTTEDERVVKRPLSRGPDAS